MKKMKPKAKQKVKQKMKQTAASVLTKLSRKPDSHKGDNGVVLIIGGSETYVGAPALAALAALRGGCDLAIVAAPDKTAWAISALSPDLITVKLKGAVLDRSHAKQLLKYIRKADVILVGPGAGLEKTTRALINTVIALAQKLGKFLVIDADALKCVQLNKVSRAILTPHAKELELMLKNNQQSVLAQKIARSRDMQAKSALLRKEISSVLRRHNVILLKGAHDVIISAKKTIAIRGGNPGMTVGGTGDVLAGLCASYLAQTGDLLFSAVHASKMNKAIGDLLLAKSNFGFGFIASDFLRELKKLEKIKKIKKSKKSKR
ncbi:NAD(P)H-hydrate dehydratase [Candidatus Woesearchaeota archaeon]|nr:NAD(P)H-hydrate dehydratase [Candidatus Woesearchaeota archaeon]